VVRVATGQGKVMEIQDQGKVREFCAGSEKFEILRKVREIQENSVESQGNLTSHVIRVTREEKGA